jgi:hypothetical protein
MVLLQHGTNLNLQTPAQVATFGASMADLVSDLRTQSGKAALPFIVDMAPPDPRAGATTGGSTFAVNSVSARRQTVDYINSGVTAVYAGTQLYDVQRKTRRSQGSIPRTTAIRAMAASPITNLSQWRQCCRGRPRRAPCHRRCRRKRHADADHGSARRPGQTSRRRRTFGTGSFPRMTTCPRPMRSRRRFGRMQRISC